MYRFPASQSRSLRWEAALQRKRIGHLSRQVFSRQIDKCAKSGNPSEFVFQWRSRFLGEIERMRRFL
ncbi:hypothetical protein TNCV_4162841 [Trichonephila clavipes]|nr:hypothetical protein TNCV_4162841 [Trichonephila clavipes]